MHDHGRYRELALAVFKQAVSDATHRDVPTEDRESAIQFLRSTGETLHFWASVADVNPEFVRAAARRRFS